MELSGEQEQPPILLEAPEEPGRTQYFWVPLLTPVYVGATQVSGFWCHRRVSSPVEAFKAFLSRHLAPRDQVLISGGQLQLNNVFTGMRPGPSLPARSEPSTITGPATPILDQVIRERQQMIERAGRPAGSGRSVIRPGGHRGRR